MRRRVACNNRHRHAALIFTGSSSAVPRNSLSSLPLLTDGTPHRSCGPPLQSPFTSRARRELRCEFCDGTDAAWLAKLIHVRGMEGTGTIELEGHRLDINTEDPGRVWARAANAGRVEHGGNRDVVLALYLVDSL